MPSLFMGATAGSGFARLVAPAWGFSAVSPGAFGLVGMAAAFAAVARAPLTSILIVFEITGDYGLVLPLMVATAISTFLAGWVSIEVLHCQRFHCSNSHFPVLLVSPEDLLL